VDLVSVQHDFGKFGRWPEGGEFAEDYLVPFLSALTKPAVVTMHTVAPFPRERMRRAVQAMAQQAAGIVVMANIAKVLLQEEYGLPEAALAKVHRIAHGVPACAETGTRPSLAAAKRLVGLTGHRVLPTFGLLHASKGIEDAIAAVPALVARYRDVLYLVIGQTRPETRKRHGEAYRTTLLAQCRDLGVAGYVRFVNRFLSQRDLVRYLAATDIYVTTYRSRQQITSRTLAYAIGCGKAIVSTPYLYATEALAEGRGLLAPFGDAASLASAVDQVLGNAAVRRSLEEQTIRYGQAMAWSRVAANYRACFEGVLGQHAAPNSPVPLRDRLHARAGGAGAAITARMPPPWRGGVPAG
jgi:glycosyltransferase involved in cell wall biosynthesis